MCDGYSAASYPGASEVCDTRAKAYSNASQRPQGTRHRLGKDLTKNTKCRVGKEAPGYEAGSSE